MGDTDTNAVGRSVEMWEKERRIGWIEIRK